MIVFKFGGASVKSADAIRNVFNIIKDHSDKKLMVVVSAMGKTTNNLEKILHLCFEKQPYEIEYNAFYDFHYQIIHHLFPDKEHVIYAEFNQYLDDLKEVLSSILSSSINYAYDSVIPFGEMISTRIIQHYLVEKEVKVKWLAAPDYIITNNDNKEAIVDWEKTAANIQNDLPSFFSDYDVLISQGFVGGTIENEITTLGREGSDFTASIFAYCLDAESVTIWKDVPGLLNADPKYSSDTKKIDQLSYHETIELAFYGASIIHPKTIKPLQNKNIPLYVKSFLHPEQKGTKIHKDRQFDTHNSSVIFKKNQVLMSISSVDFSFMNEENISRILHDLSNKKIKINTMQNSAITLSICFDYDSYKLEAFLKDLKPIYKVRYNTQLKLVTIRHYNQEIINKMVTGGKILLEQYSRKTAQFVIDEKVKHV